MIFVFYAGQLHEELASMKDFKHMQVTCDPEIYNGAYVYNPLDIRSGARLWYRMDGTPVLLDDVPKELRLLVLLLT